VPWPHGTDRAAGPVDPTAAASDALGPVVRWLAWLPDPVHLHLACATAAGPVRTPRRAFAVRLAGCAADLPASAYLELVAAGALSVTVHDPHPGAGPATGAADAALRRGGRSERVAVAPGSDAGQAAAPPDAAGSSARRPRPVRDAATLGLPRRAVLAPAGAVRPGGRWRAGTEPARLRDALAALGLPADRPDDTPGGAGGERGARVLDAPGCTACGVCARACPAGALRLVGTGAGAVRGPGAALDAGAAPHPAAAPTATLRQDVAACTACGRCVDLCPPRVLRLVPAPAWVAAVGGGVRDVARVPLRSCARCATEFGGGGTARLCPGCAHRRAHPFGSARAPLA